MPDFTPIKIFENLKLFHLNTNCYNFIYSVKGTTTTLCVRRATYWCPELKADDPAKKVRNINYFIFASCIILKVEINYFLTIL